MEKKIISIHSNHWCSSKIKKVSKIISIFYNTNEYYTNSFYKSISKIINF